jgi:nucleolar MIF4G domain-containing protein 1
VLAHEPLRVTLEDLHSAESKGKWWLVGAAWGGDPLVDRQMNAAETVATARKEENQESELLKLARSQGMNSDIRRSIFVVLMSSDVGHLVLLSSVIDLSLEHQDYIDACERLSQLNLTDVQQREIIRVVLHCCGQVRYLDLIKSSSSGLCRRSYTILTTASFANNCVVRPTRTRSRYSSACGTFFVNWAKHLLVVLE